MFERGGPKITGHQLGSDSSTVKLLKVAEWLLFEPVVPWQGMSFQVCLLPLRSRRDL